MQLADRTISILAPPEGLEGARDRSGSTRALNLVWWTSSPVNTAFLSHSASWPPMSLMEGDGRRPSLPSLRPVELYPCLVGGLVLAEAPIVGPPASSGVLPQRLHLLRRGLDLHFEGKLHASYLGGIVEAVLRAPRTYPLATDINRLRLDVAVVNSSSSRQLLTTCHDLARLLPAPPRWPPRSRRGHRGRRRTLTSTRSTPRPRRAPPAPDETPRGAPPGTRHPRRPAIAPSGSRCRRHRLCCASMCHRAPGWRGPGRSGGFHRT